MAMKIGKAVEIPLYVDEYGNLLEQLKQITDGKYLPISDDKRTVLALRSGIASAMLRRGARVETSIDSEKGLVFVRLYACCFCGGYHLTQDRELASC